MFMSLSAYLVECIKILLQRTISPSGQESVKKRGGCLLAKPSDGIVYVDINALEDLTKGSENPGSRSFLRILIGI